MVYEKFPQAMQWARETVKFMNKKYKVQGSVYLDILGG